jgi:hypothetical protein
LNREKGRLAGDTSGFIVEALERAERAVEAKRPLAGTGFWKAVEELRRNPGLAAQFADRVAAIDRNAFESSVKLRVPAAVGNLVLGAATAAGLAALIVASRLEGLWRTLFFLAGFGILDVSTHSLTHWVVGRFFGIRFTHYFVGGPPPPRPGAKIDYATYLRTPAKERAVMHASGAVKTKLLPFALIPVGLALDVERWAIALLALVGVGQIATDLLFSTKTSDWKKVKRELRAARGKAS